MLFLDFWSIFFPKTHIIGFGGKFLATKDAQNSSFFLLENKTNMIPCSSTKLCRDPFPQELRSAKLGEADGKG